MRFCLLLLIGSLASFGQDSINAVARPRNFYRGPIPGPKFMTANPDSGLVKTPGAKPGAPFTEQPAAEPVPTGVGPMCGHILIYRPKSKSFIKTVPLPDKLEEMPEVKPLPLCPADLR